MLAPRRGALLSYSSIISFFVHIIVIHLDMDERIFLFFLLSFTPIGRGSSRLIGRSIVDNDLIKKGDFTLEVRSISRWSSESIFLIVSF